MSNPTNKSPEIRGFMDFLAGCDTEDRIKKNRCTMCGGSAIEFSDALSAREFQISGMCQDCQDSIFGDD